MRLLTYEQARDMPDNYLSSFVDAEIECWGSHPFDEFKKCDNPRCGALYSIEDVYGTVDEYRNRVKNVTLIDNFKCEECGDNTLNVYEKDEFMSMSQEYVKGDVSLATYINDNSNVEGLGVITKTTIDDLLQVEFNTRSSPQDSEALFDLVSNYFSLDSDILCLLHVYLSKNLRGGTNFFELLKNLFLLRQKNSDLPIVTETRYDSNLYSMLKVLGFNVLTDDQFGYVYMYLDKFSKIIDFIKADKLVNSNEIKVLRACYKKEALDIISKTPLLNLRKHYI
ncbi:MAG: hypothetical protein PHN31_03420 [Candidatus Gracilibacteria bacterium]|nr:hypothetical protein [Candidatus Gracilibacteria bacterium]